MVKLLYSHGVDIHQADKKGETPLYVACQNRHLELVKLLISYGADIHQTKNDGTTPLQTAERGNKTEVVEFLRDLYSLV